MTHDEFQEMPRNAQQVLLELMSMSDLVELIYGDLDMVLTIKGEKVDLAGLLTKMVETIDAHVEERAFNMFEDRYQAASQKVVDALADFEHDLKTKFDLHEKD